MTKPKSSVDADNNSAASPTSGDNDKIPTRVGSRTKKAKIVFDPSDSYAPRKRSRRRDSVASTPEILPPASRKELPLITVKLSSLTSRPSKRLSIEVPNVVRKKTLLFCALCEKHEPARKHTKFSSCSKCALRAHTKCIKKHSIYAKLGLHNFTCVRCIRCTTCGKPTKEENFLHCLVCKQTYHATCQESSSKKKFLTCKSCQPQQQQPQQQQQQQQQKRQRSTSVTDSKLKQQRSYSPAEDETHQEFAGFSDLEIKNESIYQSDDNGDQYADGELNGGEDVDVDVEDDGGGGECDDADDEASKKQQEEKPSPKNNKNKKNRSTSSSSSLKEEKPKSESKSTFEFVRVNEDSKTFGRNLRLNNNWSSFENLGQWSCEEVFQYFQQHFAEHAKLFKEHEIDGRSLLLMRKSDVVKGFGLKLGPAMILYQRILMMQNNDLDFRLTWL